MDQTPYTVINARNPTPRPHLQHKLRKLPQLILGGRQRRLSSMSRNEGHLENVCSQRHLDYGSPHAAQLTFRRAVQRAPPASPPPPDSITRQIEDFSPPSRAKTCQRNHNPSHESIYQNNFGRPRRHQRKNHALRHQIRRHRKTTGGKPSQAINTFRQIGSPYRYINHRYCPYNHSLPYLHCSTPIKTSRKAPLASTTEARSL